jgi:hypothetical protein
MTTDGYVVIDYKKVNGEYIVDKIEPQMRNYIKKINENDWSGAS